MIFFCWLGAAVWISRQWTLDQWGRAGGGATHSRHHGRRKAFELCVVGGGHSVDLRKKKHQEGTEKGKERKFSLQTGHAIYRLYQELRRRIRTPKHKFHFIISFYKKIYVQFVIFKTIGTLFQNINGWNKIKSNSLRNLTVDGSQRRPICNNLWARFVFFGGLKERKQKVKVILFQISSLLRVYVCVCREIWRKIE